MEKKYAFSIWIIPILLVILMTYCGSSTGPDISDFEIYYFNSDNLDAAADSTGLIIIIFRNASGENEEIEAEIPDEDTTLYDENGYMLELWETGGIYYIYPIMGGSRAYAVGLEGVVVEHEKYVDENTYMVHFIDTTTGNINYTADIVDNPEDGFLAIFRDPVNDTVEVEVNTFFTNIRYGLEFDNEAGDGAVEFRTDVEGYVYRVDSWL